MCYRSNSQMQAFHSQKVSVSTRSGHSQQGFPKKFARSDAPPEGIVFKLQLPRTEDDSQGSAFALLSCSCIDEQCGLSMREKWVVLRLHWMKCEKASRRA